MIRATLLAAAMLVCAPVQADYVSTWSGAGPNACDGRCDLDWFQVQMTPKEQADLAAARALQPEPGLVTVHDGDVFSMMSYFKDGRPVAYRTSTVASLDGPAYGVGWVLGDYIVAKMDDCTNWSVIEPGLFIPLQVEAIAPRLEPMRVAEALLPTPAVFWTGATDGFVEVIEIVEIVNPFPNPNPILPKISLPPTLTMFAGALWLLLMLTGVARVRRR